MAIPSRINQFETFRTWQVSRGNYLGFPDFFIQMFFGRHEAGIIRRQMQNKERVFEFAKLGTTKLKSEDDKP
jgi:hypothetical protein